MILAFLTIIEFPSRTVQRQMLGMCTTMNVHIHYVIISETGFYVCALIKQPSYCLSLSPPPPPSLRFWSMMALVSLVALRFLYVSYSQRRGGPRKTPSSDGFKFTAINPFVSTAMYMYYMYIINYICLSICPLWK